jgi:hypothetical protein
VQFSLYEFVCIICRSRSRHASILTIPDRYPQLETLVNSVNSFKRINILLTYLNAMATIKECMLRAHK